MSGSAEVYPAIVDTPAGRWVKARTVVEGGEILLFGQDNNGAISLVRRATLVEPPVPAVTVTAAGPFANPRGAPAHTAAEYPARVLTDEGVWLVNVEGGCGCGASLKGVSRTALLRLAAQ